MAWPEAPAVEHRPLPKRSIDDLALFGGPQAFREPLHVGRPNIGDEARFMERMRAAFDRHVLTNDGPLVRELEARLAELTGARHVVAVVNGTVGLEIASRALGLEGEVIVPSFTFVATAHALSWIGLRPVFCDIDPETLTIDVEHAATLIGPRTTGILGVHVYGRICDVDGLERLARAHGLALMFDAAHALGSQQGGRRVGTFGDAEVFSFHATKFINSFEGGAIATDDPAVAERARLLRNFGISGYDATEGLGTNGKMHEASAAMGITSLESIDDLIAADRDSARRYEEGLAGISAIRLLGADIRESTAAQYVVIRVAATQAGLSRDRLQQVLVAENVLARRYFYPGCHRLEPYASQTDAHHGALPATEQACAEVLALPTGPSVGAAAILGICELIRFSVDHGEEVMRREPAHPGAGILRGRATE
jgi:dTDP-4-amino-4,6-dideoxygalactose transaminase